MDPTTCTVLLVALAALTLLGWGAWLREVNRRQGPAPDAAITIAPPVRAVLYVPPEAQESTSAAPATVREESPEWVMERMMDERFEPVRAPSPSDRGSDWL